MDEWAWEELRPWLELRVELPVGPLFWVKTDQRDADTGQVRPPERSCAGPPSRPASGGGSRRTSCGTRMPSSSLAKACH